MKNNQLTLKDANNSINMTYELESRKVKGSIQEISGGFPAGSTMVIQLIDKSKADSQSATIGMEIIQVKEAKFGPVKFSVNYAPHLIQRGSSYRVNVDVINKGKLIYTNSLNNVVKLSYTPTKLQNDINDNFSENNQTLLSVKKNDRSFW